MANPAQPGQPTPENPGSKKAEDDRGNLLFFAFAICFILSGVIYVWLHWAFPDGGILTETKARDAALTAIAQASSTLTDTLTLAEVTAVFTQTTTTISNTVGSANGVTATTFLVPLVNTQTQELAQLAREGQKRRFEAARKGLAEVVRAAALPGSAPLISSTLQLIDEEMKLPEPDVPKLQVLVNQLDRVVIDRGDRYFWTGGFGKWLEFLFWGLFGSLFFMLREIRSWYTSDLPNRRFVEYTPWCIEVAARGAIISILIMFFFTNFDVNAFGVSFSLKNTPIEFQIFIAAVLGYYNRVAKAQLDLFMQNIFKDAWQASTAQPSPLTIVPANLILELGESKQLKVNPPQDVVWSLEPATLGKITTAGLYTAPSQEEHAGQTVKVKAVSAVDSKKAAIAPIVIQRKFALSPAQARIKFGDTRAFSTGRVGPTEWTINPSNAGKINTDGTYTAPPKRGSRVKAGRVTITAKLLDEPERVTEGTIILTR